MNLHNVTRKEIEALNNAIESGNAKAKWVVCDTIYFEIELINSGLGQGPNVKNASYLIPVDCETLDAILTHNLRPELDTLQQRNAYLEAELAKTIIERNTLKGQLQRVMAALQPQG